jgi:hypothetical protein
MGKYTKMPVKVFEGSGKASCLFNLEDHADAAGKGSETEKQKANSLHHEAIRWS